MLAQFWDFIVRARTWVLASIAILIELAPEILGSAEVLDVVPERWRHVLIIGLLVWSRWRLATRSSDPEVLVKKVIERTDDPSTIIVEERGQTVAVVEAKP